MANRKPENRHHVYLSPEKWGTLQKLGTLLMELKAEKPPKTRASPSFFLRQLLEGDDLALAILKEKIKSNTNGTS